VGRLAGTVLPILTVLTAFSTPLKPACGAAFRKMQISKNRKSHIKKSQVAYQKIASRISKNRKWKNGHNLFLLIICE
jgi:hypothetical protein